MRTLRRLLLLIILLAVAGVIFAHWFVGNPSGISFIEKKIAAETGLKVTVGSAQFTPDFSLMISDLRIWFTTDDAKEITVLAAPEVTLSRKCHGYFVQLARPVFTAVKSKFGDWTPAQLRVLQDSGTFDTSIIRLAKSFEYSFEIKDASVVLKDEGGEVFATYSGLNWSHRQAFVVGHPGMMQDVVSLQCIDGEQADFAHEWLSDEKEVYPLVHSRPVEKQPVVEAPPAKVEAATEKPIEKQTPVIVVKEPKPEVQTVDEPVEQKKD